MLKKAHKIIGISFALIILHLSVTGLFLMFPKYFNLYDKYYEADWILDSFGMFTHSDVLASSIDKDIVFIGSNLVIDGELIQLSDEKLIAGLRLNGVIAVVSENSLMIVSETNLDYEVRKAKSFDIAISLAGIDSDGNIILDQNGNRLMISKKNNDYVIAPTNHNYKRIYLQTLERAESSYYLNLIQGPGVQALRLVTDLHNGRFFGMLAIFLFTVAGISTIFLALSGSFMTLRPIIYKKYYKIKNRKK